MNLNAGGLGKWTRWRLVDANTGIYITSLQELESSILNSAPNANSNSSLPNGAPAPVPTVWSSSSAVSSPSSGWSVGTPATRRSRSVRLESKANPGRYLAKLLGTDSCTLPQGVKLDGFGQCSFQTTFEIEVVTSPPSYSRGAPGEEMGDNHRRHCKGKRRHDKEERKQRREECRKKKQGRMAATTMTMMRMTMTDDPTNTEESSSSSGSYVSAQGTDDAVSITSSASQLSLSTDNLPSSQAVTTAFSQMDLSLIASGAAASTMRMVYPSSAPPATSSSQDGAWNQQQQQDELQRQAVLANLGSRPTNDLSK